MTRLPILTVFLVCPDHYNALIIGKGKRLPGLFSSCKASGESLLLRYKMAKGGGSLGS